MAQCAMASDEIAEHRDQLRFASRQLHGGASAVREPDHAELTRVVAYCEAHGIRADGYGDGDALQAFEQRVADMLGYPAARFMPSGTMAQQIAMRIWSERAGIDVFGMHPTCHLELHEERGYARLHGLDAALIGSTHRPMVAADLAAAPEPISALIVELPTRENGGQLAAWPEIIELSESAHERGVMTHLDGARLWEASVGYGKPLDEICALFDSTYVSFYKGIGALPGAMLAGPEEFIAEAIVWQRRHGGNLYNSMANWVSAEMRLDAQIAKMSRWHERAIEIAAALRPIDGITINPGVPHVNMFHIYLTGSEEDLLIARDRVAEELNLWLFGGLTPTDVAHWHRFEFVAGEAACELDLTEIVAAFAMLVG